MYLNETGKSFTQYLSELKGKHIPPDQQKPLWEAYFAEVDSKKKLELRNRLYEANLPLVVHYVTRNHGKRGNIMDLIQEGNIGLLRAIEKFEPEKGNAFSTYATWWMNAFVNTGAKKLNSPVHIPLNLLRASTIPQQVYTGVAPGEVNVADDADGPDACYEAMEAQDQARKIISRTLPFLDEREVYVLRHYLLREGDDACSLQEIADKYECSREWVRQCAIKVQDKIQLVADGKRPTKKAVARHSVPQVVRESTVDLSRFGLAFLLQKPELQVAVTVVA